jgi:serine/threonine-protein kinase
VPPQDVPPGLEAIILKALSKKPEQRYQTMDEFAQDFDKLARGMIPDAVPEMMSRSGGFNVPADFFKERGMPAPVPATPMIPGSRGRWGVYAGVAGVVAAIAIVVAIFAKSSSSTASSNLVAPAAVAPAVVTQAPPPPAPPATPAVPEAKHVLFASEPLDAHVFQNGSDLGATPVTVDVPVGQKVTIEVRREGYKTQLVTLDGAQAKVKTNLVRAPMPGGKHPGARPAGGEAATQKPPAAQTPAPSLGGGEIVNPWAK